MAAKTARDDRIDTVAVRRRLEELWTLVSEEAETHSAVNYVSDADVCAAIRDSLNHRHVSYRFCLPVQLLGKLCNPNLDCLALQRGKEQRAWNARSLASRVVAPFNAQQENVLGTSADPYVGNAMRVRRMLRDDSSKKDLQGWHTLIDVLERVEERNEPVYTEAVLKQVLLEIHRLQKTLRFTYPQPPRVSLATALDISQQFLGTRSGGDRALALAGALFDVIGTHFRLYAQVNRARINASDEASGQAADLECVNDKGEILIAVEVKDRALRLTDVEGTLTKTRYRVIRDVFFTSPRVEAKEVKPISDRIAAAFAGGQNLYVVDLVDLARVTLALGGEGMRALFLRRVGEHLDTWNTQPSNRQAWKKLLEAV
ncbi:MAG: restriction endonuclease, SacI family [Gammaproteobacteria bacterium]